MNRATVALVAIAFLAVGALPRVFFRSGALNARWWATAWPFFACPVLLVAFAAGLVPTPARLWQLYPGQDIAPLLPAAASLLLIGMTLGTHRIPIALWHQDDDAPREIVTWGPYARIRHPFYASFLLAFAGACLAFPHPAILALAAYTAVALDRTAAREERRLSASAYGKEYAEYMTRTGRFFPRFG